MARQARFIVPGQVHWVSLEMQSGGQALAQGGERAAMLAALRCATQQHTSTALHGYAIRAGGVELLLTPHDSATPGRFVQSLGRQFVVPHNRRQGRSGALWASRYRCTVLEPGEAVMLALCAVCLSAAAEVDAAEQDDCAAHYLGQQRTPWITDLLDFWRLGNEPFAREARLRAKLQSPELPAQVAQFRKAARQARAMGGGQFLRALEQQTGRPLVARRAGRPRHRPEAAPTTPSGKTVGTKGEPR